MESSDWHKICPKCVEDGLPEGIYCPYYGEPNGCNSPVYGKHPDIPRNGKVMSDALIEIKRTIEEHPCQLDEDAVYKIVCEALRSEPRRCDIYEPELAAHIMETNYCNSRPDGFCDGRECSKCSFKWYTS